MYNRELKFSKIGRYLVDLLLLAKFLCGVYLFFFNAIFLAFG
jgi:hypothetical protein